MIKSVLILDEFFAMNAKIGTLFLSHINIVKYLTHRNTELLNCADMALPILSVVETERLTEYPGTAEEIE